MPTSTTPVRATPLDFTGLQRLTNISQLHHGMRVCGVTGGGECQWIPEAKINLTASAERFFICQNVVRGDDCYDYLGFAYSWSVRFDPATGEFPRGYVDQSHSNSRLELYALPEGMVAGPAPLPLTPAAPRTRRVLLERVDQLRHLMHVSGRLDDIAFDDGVIDYHPGSPFFHVCQNEVNGYPISDRHGYDYSWMRGLRLSDGAGIHTSFCELYFEEETEEVIPPSVPGIPVSVRRFSQLKPRAKLWGKLGGLPFDDATCDVVVRRSPESLYILNDVAGRGTVTPHVKKCLDVIRKKDGGKYKFAWMIPAVNGILYFSPGTELFMTEPAAQPDPRRRFDAAHPPTLNDLQELEEIIRGDECEDGLPVWVKTYRGTICIGRLRQEAGMWYICTDCPELNGSPASNRHGFDYSFSFTCRRGQRLALNGLRFFRHEV